jgi:hypothetical protein
VNKTDALAHFGDPTTDQGRAAAVSAMADFFGISRAAIYMWPDDKPIPQLRALQIEMRARSRRGWRSRGNSEQGACLHEPRTLPVGILRCHHSGGVRL